MKTYAVESGDITPQHLMLFDRVWEILLELPEGLDCHQVCKAIVERIPELQHKRGSFYKRGICHSWLTIPDQETIIDAYPWASALPLIVTTVGLFNPWRQLYIEHSETNHSESLP